MLYAGKEVPCYRNVNLMLLLLFFIVQSVVYCNAVRNVIGIHLIVTEINSCFVFWNLDLEQYMFLNIRTGNGNVGGIENCKRLAKEKVQ